MPRSLRVLFLVASAALVAGCGGGSGRPTPNAKEQATVSGSVVNDGKPLPIDCVVVFNSKDKGAIGSGKLDSLGKFRIAAGDSGVGLPAGRYLVKIAPPAAAPVGNIESDSYKQVMMGKAKATPEPPKDIPAKFLNWETSGLVFELQPGANTFDIDLAKVR